MCIMHVDCICIQMLEAALFVYEWFLLLLVFRGEEKQDIRILAEKHTSGYGLLLFSSSYQLVTSFNLCSSHSLFSFHAIVCSSCVSVSVCVIRSFYLFFLLVSSSSKSHTSFMYYISIFVAFNVSMRLYDMDVVWTLFFCVSPRVFRFHYWKLLYAHNGQTNSRSE